MKTVNISLVLGVLTWGVLLFAGTTNAACTRMNIFDREDGLDSVTPIRVFSPPHCVNLVPGSNWHSRAKALRMTANIGCIKVYSSSDCSGQGQCVCQKNHRMLTSWDSSIVPGGSALSFGNCDSSVPHVGGTIQVFADENLSGASDIFQIPKGQCESLRNDEDWKDKISSLKVTQGCVEYFNQAGCKGDSDILFEGNSEFGDEDNQVQSLDSTFNNRVRSFKSCVTPEPGPEPEVPAV